MKKILMLAASAFLAAACLCACGTTGKNTSENTESSGAGVSASGENTASDTEDTLQIVTTIFPEYDWVREILGDNPSNAGVTLLLDDGVDLHSYQPTAEDIAKIANCDIFIYVGGESDEWVEDALKEAVNPDMIVINLLEDPGSSVKEEELAEGMQPEEEDDDADEASEEGPEYDEHVWLSLPRASALCGSVADAVCRADPAYADMYRENAEAYREKLDALDAEYREAVAQAGQKTVLFGDRFPFRYMTDDYGLDYYAAFSGCSAETEASFETVMFLAQKVDELGLKHVLTIEGTDHRIAETIIENTQTKDQDILVMDSMQSVTSADVENGAAYLALMKQNLDVLKEALQ